LLYTLAVEGEAEERARYLLVDLAKQYQDNSWRSLAVLGVTA
jgi:hypothetical protein